MTQRNEIYRCPVCGNVVEVLHQGAVLSCCGRPMLRIEANSTDASEEKHVPMVTTEGQRLCIKIGATEHPMSDEHHIEWIQVVCGSRQLTFFLKPGDKPEICVPMEKLCRGEGCPAVKEPVTVRAYCNLHGLWTKTV